LVTPVHRREADADAAIGEGVAQFEVFVNLITNMLWQSRPDGFTYWQNDRWYEYTGQPREEALGWGWAATVHPDDHEIATVRYAEAMALGVPFRTEYRVRGADGEYRWFSVRAEPVLDAEGVVTKWIGSATDIHSEKMAYQEVERLVIHRTGERDSLRRQLASVEEDERRRLARDLHDQLGQHLTAFSLNIAEANRLLDEGKSIKPRLAQLELLARIMTRDARYLALELRPPELDDAGLEGALETYVEQWRERFDVRAELSVTGIHASLAIPNEISTALYRIAQEALTNIAKHARAEHVDITLRRDGDRLRLAIADDGVGFDPSEPSAGFGLVGMSERVALVGGTLEIDAGQGGGVRLEATFPIAGG